MTNDAKLGLRDSPCSERFYTSNHNHFMPFLKKGGRALRPSDRRERRHSSFAIGAVRRLHLAICSA